MKSTKTFKTRWSNLRGVNCLNLNTHHLKFPRIYINLILRTILSQIKSSTTQPLQRCMLTSTNKWWETSPIKAQISKVARRPPGQGFPKAARLRLTKRYGTSTRTNEITGIRWSSKLKIENRLTGSHCISIRGRISGKGGIWRSSSWAKNRWGRNVLSIPR